MNKHEVYVADDRYSVEVERITDILRAAHIDAVARYSVEHVPADRGELLDRLHAALRSAGVDMGDMTVIDGQVMPTIRADLVEALASIQPDACTGEIEADQVKFVLGEIGNVWPESIRIQAAALAQLEAAHAFTRPLLENVTSMAMRGSGVFRAHLDGVAGDAARQVMASMKHFRQP